ncbi:hypothetical protein, partial [Vibrio breoganii]|uniref:hypothetical protein n=1 Tax=Vibrio breoganii TaxID=553239 RepID=UPI001A7E1115
RHTRVLLSSIYYFGIPQCESKISDRGLQEMFVDPSTKTHRNPSYSSASIEYLLLNTPQCSSFSLGLTTSKQS